VQTASSGFADRARFEVRRCVWGCLETLYLVLKVGSGPERTYVGHFRSWDDCEWSMARNVERKSADVTYVRYVCWERGTWAPDWIAEKRINGVPLDPRFMPKG
jgi:hypothetical protein